MEQLADVIKIFIEKHLMPSIISIAGTIATYLFFPQDNWIVVKLGTTMFILLFFCSYFLLVQLLIIAVRSFNRFMVHRIYEMRENKEEEQKAIQQINKFFDRLSPQDKNILLTFVKNGNKIMLTYQHYYGGFDSFLENYNLVNVSDYIGNIHTLDKEHYWILPELEEMLISQTEPVIGLKQYRIKNEFFKDLVWVYKSNGKLGNF